MASPFRFLVLALLVSGCPTTPPRRDAGSRRDAGPDTGCPYTELAAERGHPSVVWVVERSCGAALRVNGTASSSATDSQSRFFVAADGIRRAQERFMDSFTWGLITHPNAPSACGSSGSLNVEPSEDSAPRVLAELARSETNAFNYCVANPASGAGVGDALSALAETNLADVEQTVAVVIGMSAPTCGNADAATLSTQTGALSDLGYVLPVIQVGSSAPAVESLEAIAARGGGGIATEAPFRFTAADGPSLDTAIDAVLMSTNACVFTIADATDIMPEEIVVTADGDAVPADAENGFGFWPPDGTVTFRGSYCRSLLEGAITSVRIGRIRCAN